MTWSSNEAMIEEARKQDLLIYSHYQEMWSTPDDLERLQKAGRFRYGNVNFELRSRQNYITKLNAEKQKLTNKIFEIDGQIAKVMNETSLIKEKEE